MEYGWGGEMENRCGRKKFVTGERGLWEEGRSLGNGTSMERVWLIKHRKG